MSRPVREVGQTRVDERLDEYSFSFSRVTVSLAMVSIETAE